MRRVIVSKSRRNICLDDVNYVARTVGGQGRYYGEWACQACAKQGTHGQFVSSIRLANRMADLLVAAHHQSSHANHSVRTAGDTNLALS